MRNILIIILVVPTLVSLELFSKMEYDLDDLQKYLNNKQTSFPNRGPNIEPVKNMLYREECSDCHFLYSRGMLPERSWIKLMSVKSLKDHFEEEIELGEGDRSMIESYLIDNSSEKSKYKISKKINRSIKSEEIPIKISDVRFIRRQHREIPDKYISKNAKVVSLSQCGACHQRINQGIIDQDEVYFPYEKIK